MLYTEQMTPSIDDLINKVTENCTREDFEYREWFVSYHLRIVEEVALKLAAAYPEADKDLVRVLAWTHDYSKPLTRDKESEKSSLLPMVRTALSELSFDETYIANVCSRLEEIESKDTRPIEKASIEAQIISSADGAAHLIGPFFYSYFRNDPSESIIVTMQRVMQKANRDWEKKILLPEARELVRVRYEKLKEDMQIR